MCIQHWKKKLECLSQPPARVSGNNKWNRKIVISQLPDLTSSSSFASCSKAEI